MFIISAQPNFSKRKTCGSPVSRFIPQVFIYSSKFSNLSNVFLCAHDPVLILSVNANLYTVLRLRIFLLKRHTVSRSVDFSKGNSLTSRTNNTLTVLSVNVTARQVFHYLASSALPSMLLPGKQGAKRYLRQFLHRIVGNTSQTQKSHFV